jgi:hypothetical protein
MFNNSINVVHIEYVMCIFLMSIANMPWYDLLSDSTKEKLSCNSKNIIGRKGGGSLVVKIANEQTYFRLKKFKCQTY